ncbi:MAG: hypothetical protein U5L45_16680 [Saprospiraceae bacterium]|nr:hypothetical protein [Saprospiraceae bacterium]
MVYFLGFAQKINHTSYFAQAKRARNQASANSYLSKTLLVHNLNFFTHV